MNLNIQMVENYSLVEKVCELCHIRGKKWALNQKIEIELDKNIAIGKEEIIRRLEFKSKAKKVVK